MYLPEGFPIRVVQQHEFEFGRVRALPTEVLNPGEAYTARLLNDREVEDNWASDYDVHLREVIKPRNRFVGWLWGSTKVVFSPVSAEGLVLSIVSESKISSNGILISKRWGFCGAKKTEGYLITDNGSYDLSNHELRVGSDDRPRELINA
jgi:hypothetical protein